MSLNDQENGGNVDWAHKTWNVQSGCLHGCFFCYVNDFATRFEGTVAWPKGMAPAFHPERLGDIDRLNKRGNLDGKRIFVGSSGDTFGEWVPRENIKQIIEVFYRHPKVNFLCLTKNPARYKEFEFPGNAWLGTTVFDTDALNRGRYADFLEVRHRGIKFVSVEPIIGDVAKLLRSGTRPDWVILGAMTGRFKKKYPPKREHVENVIFHCEANDIPLLIKRNVKWEEPMEQYPNRVM